jgi:integrase
MPRKVKELTAYQIKRLSKKPGFHAVGGVAGLHLNVSDTLASSWILRATVGGRRRDIGCGGYPDTTLEQARTLAREIRLQIRQGIDPVAARQEARNALKVAGAKRMMFSEAATACWKTKSQEFKNKKHRAQWLSTITEYASPVIGSLPVADVELPHIIKVLEPIWTTKTETASRLRGRIESVLAWAKVSGYRTGDNPARWKGNLDHVLPKPSKVHKVEHHPALPWHRVPEFMATLKKRAGKGARALEFLILTAARSGEVRLATWDHIDLEAKVWTVPGEYMKAGLPHRVPLTEPAIKLLKALPRFVGSTYVFPAPKGGALSDMSIAAVIKRMHEDSIKSGGEDYLDPQQNKIATPHGFRSSFKDWCRSCTSHPDEVSELALAHVSSDETRAAYARDELLPKRTRLMRDWARFLETVPKKAAVTPIRRG